MKRKVGCLNLEASRLTAISMALIRCAAPHAIFINPSQVPLCAKRSQRDTGLVELGFVYRAKSVGLAVQVVSCVSEPFLDVAYPYRSDGIRVQTQQYQL